MVVTRKGTNADDPEEGQIILFLQSATFAEILDKIVERRTSELLQKVHQLETTVKIICDTNKDLIALLTNAPSTFFQKHRQETINMVDLSSSDSPDFLNRTVVEQKTSNNKKSSDNELDHLKRSKPAKPDEDNDFTFAYKNRKQHRYGELKTGGPASDNSHASKNNSYLNKNKYSNSKVKRPHAIFGTGTQNNSDITAVNRKSWIYVGRVTSGTGVAGIKKHCNITFPGREIVVEMLPKWKNGTTEAFKIKIDYDLLDQAFISDNWPTGSLIKRYKFFQDHQSKSS